MANPLALDYGERPYPAAFPEGTRFLVAPTPTEPAPSLESLMESALGAPIDASRKRDR